MRKLGDLLLLEKKTAEALVQYKRAAAIQDQLVAEHYEDPDFAADVAKVKKQIATCCRR